MDEQRFKQIFDDLSKIKQTYDTDLTCSGLGQEAEMVHASADRLAEELDPRKFSDEQRADVVLLLRMAFSWSCL